MSIREINLDNLPTPLAHACQMLLDEPAEQPFRQMHRLIDVIEVFCKIYTVAGVSQLAELIALYDAQNRDEHRDEHREHLDKIKTALATGLATPSLGVWWAFAQQSSKVINQLSQAHVIPRGAAVIKSHNKKYFANDDNLIQLRNDYAHGATPENEDCKRDFTVYGERFATLLETARELADIELVVCDTEGALYLARGLTLTPLELDEGFRFEPGRCYLRSEEVEWVDLHPLLYYRSHASNKTARHSEADLGGFYFYNRLNKRDIALLDYVSADHYRDEEGRGAFLERFPIEEWHTSLKRADLNPFRKRITELLELFKGRRQELGELVEKLAGDRERFVMVWGGPGIGKSALLARLAELLRWEPERRVSAYPKIEWPELQVEVVDYYIRRGVNDSASEFFTSVNMRLDTMYQLKHGLGSSTSEQRDLFVKRLSEVSEKLSDQQRLVLIIDGLDEASDELIRFLPRASPDQIPKRVLVFYGARPLDELRYSFYDSLERERRVESTLKGLSTDDIRALLYEHVNKYQLKKEYVQDVEKASKGFPLYLELLCQGLENGHYQLNETVSLPEELERIYENIIQRIGEQSPLSLQLLCLLAIAREYVSLRLIASLLGETESNVKNSALAVSYELLMTQTHLGVERYQLFHESLRDYLTQTYRSDLDALTRRVQAWCVDWVDEQGDPKHEFAEAKYYAMRYAISYTLDAIEVYQRADQPNKLKKAQDQMLALVNDERWRQASFEATGSGEAMREGFVSAQKILIERADKASPPLRDVVRYALWYHAEPRRYYDEQRERLRAGRVVSEREDEFIERARRMASMGERPRARVLLLLSAFWGGERVGEIPESLKAEVEEWLEEARDSSLEKLWRLSHG